MNCWEYKRCPNGKKQQCEVFIYGHGKECWRVPKESHTNKTSKKESCITCSWYIKNYREGKV